MSLAMASQEPVQPQPLLLSPAKLISKMFAKYMKAKSMVGHIQLTLTTSGQPEVSSTTDFAFKPMSLVYIRQVQGQRSAQVVSNGKVFAYPRPEDTIGAPTKYLFEDVLQKGAPLDFRDIFAIGASTLIDRSAPLDFAFGRTIDLKYRAQQFIQLNDGGEVKLGDKVVRKISGPWRYREQPKDGRRFTSNYMGTFEMYITEDGDLARYVYGANFEVPVNNGAKQIVQIQWVYDTDFKVDAEVDTNIFQLPKN